MSHHCTMTSRRKGEKLSDAAGDEYMGLGPGVRCEATETWQQKIPWGLVSIHLWMFQKIHYMAKSIQISSLECLEIPNMMLYASMDGCSNQNTGEMKPQNDPKWRLGWCQLPDTVGIWTSQNGDLTIIFMINMIGGICAEMNRGWGIVWKARNSGMSGSKRQQRSDAGRNIIGFTLE